ncbi:MAG: tetratricopeptide repeat protein [Bryobacteraceae bacterium]
MRKTVPLLLLAATLFGQQTRDLQFEPEQPINPLKDRGTRWALVVGISNHQHLPPAAQLRFAHRDAEDFAAFLRTVPGGALPASHIRLLTNERATLAAIRASLHTWLVQSAGPEDVVYVFFAGHGVVGEQDEAYFIANDTDPQNLHATGLSFREVDATLSNRLRAGLVMMVADACRSGRLGWSSYGPDIPSRAGAPMAAIGQGDRSFLRLLASRASERSFEDERWGGGHGVFTYTLLEGLRGKGHTDASQPIRASEVIDYVAKIVPEETRAQQHPRVAGNFDARLSLAVLAPSPLRPEPSLAASLELAGPPGTAIYVDDVFRGRIRPTGTLRVDGVTARQSRVSADLPDGTILGGTVTARSGVTRVNIQPPDTDRLMQLQARLRSGQALEAFDGYASQPFPASQRAVAASMMSDALEELGQACVSDYVQSTATGPKKVMLRRAVAAYERLQTLRPNDAAIETRRVFCVGRFQIADGKFNEAVASLQESLRRDPQFACAQNALGVALDRLNRKDEARQAFERAARLTPEWGLPPFQIASQLITAGKLREALPHLEDAVKFNPRSVGTRWSLMRLNRLLGRPAEAERVGLDLLKVNPNYAPAHMELGLTYEAAGNAAKAAEQYDLYLLLAPNFTDSTEVRSRSERLKAQGSRPVPTLKRK